jgi:hypothetical protein
MNADPLPAAASAGRARSVAASAQAPAASYSVGSTKQFQVANEDTAPYTWFPINATLVAQGTHCYIWVASGNDTTKASTKNDNNLNEASADADDNAITTVQAKTLAAVFDKVYPLETGVLGYEYGGDPALTSTYGGHDSDPKISILIYDISGDYSPTQQGGILGYFWSKDESDKETVIDQYGTPYKSNRAEIFYIDSFFSDKYPAEIESTLIHEFQHVIGYNQKSIKDLYADTWYDEMLSLVSEEVFGTAVGLDPSGLPWGSRIPYYTASYDWYGVTDWQNTSDGILASYANSYAFGSYLLHNYGGVPLLRELEQNAAVNQTSVISAVKALNPNFKDDSQVIAQLSRYGEALVFGGTNTPASVNTFCKTAAGFKLNDGTIISLPSTNDIASVKNGAAGYEMKYEMPYGTTLKLTVPAGYTGVLAYPVSFPIGMYPGIARIYSDASWQNVTGDFTITLKRPTKADGTPNTDVSLSLYVR